MDVPRLRLQVHTNRPAFFVTARGRYRVIIADIVLGADAIFLVFDRFGFNARVRLDSRLPPWLPWSTARSVALRKFVGHSMQNVCLFAHFDKDDRVDDYVLRYLKNIKQLQFSIIFISTANLPKLEVERLQLNCDDIILRQNTGFDFASWSKGFAKHADNIGGRLLLANDSVYGPIGSLAMALDRLTTETADFYGFVESIQPTPHLQSWFLLFEPWVVQHPEFGAILGQSFSEMDKKDIIKAGELNLSRRLHAAGFKYNALYLIRRSGLAARYIPTNPTQFLWRELLLQERVPFLKVELLRDNPIGLEDAETLLSVVESIDSSFCQLIKAHLARSITKDSPPRRSRWINRLRSKLIRKGYYLSRTHRRLAEFWNFVVLTVVMVAPKLIKSSLLMVGLRVGRVLRRQQA